MHTPQLQQILHREQKHITGGHDTPGHQPTTAAHEVLRGLLLRESDVACGRRAAIPVAAIEVREGSVWCDPEQERQPPRGQVGVSRAAIREARSNTLR